MIDFEIEKDFLDDFNIPAARIKVLGVGGGGSNMVNSMIDAGYDSVDFIVANTDAQALKTSKAKNKIQLGVKLTKGLGAGANPEAGKRSAEEDLDIILENLRDADIVFLTAGMGGGTGSGALPVIAKALKERDILTVGIVTKPFAFEGNRRMRVAQEAIDLLKREINTLIVMPNQKLIEISDQKVSLMSAFGMINNILNQFVKAIADIIAKPGHINVDFADVRTIMMQKGYAIIGSGFGSGEHGARDAAMQAISSPLLDSMQMAGAKGVLLNITGSSNLSLHAIHEAVSIIYEQAHEDAVIVMGSVIDESLGDKIGVTVIATGFANQTTEEAKVSNISVKNFSKNHEEINQEKNFRDYNLDKENSSITSSVLQDQKDQKDQVIKPASQEFNSNSQNSNVNSPNAENIDLNDLDIPTIMRKSAQQQSSNS